MGGTGNAVIRSFIQARMSSNRFPGKVLAPLGGIPIIKRVISQVEKVTNRSLIAVLTSTGESDDPLAWYVERLGIAVFRGELHNVFRRFRDALALWPCEWFFRITADSPLLDPEILKRMVLEVKAGGEELDLVTDVLRRSYPVGQSAELIKTSTFLSIDSLSLIPHEQEHITAHYYRFPGRFYILNIKAPKGAQSKASMAVDTVEDLRRLELKLTRLRSPPYRGKTKD